MNPISNEELEEIVSVLRQSQDAFSYLVTTGEVPKYGEERYNVLHLCLIKDNISKVLKKIEKIEKI